MTAFIVTHNPYSLQRLHRRFPQPVQVAILIHGYDLLIAYADLGFGLILQVDADATALGLDVDKYDVVLRKHRVGYAADLDFNLSIAQILDYGHVLFAAGIYRVGDEFFHLLATAYNLDARIYDLLDYIATMTAFVKFCCHK